MDCIVSSSGGNLIMQRLINISKLEKEKVRRIIPSSNTFQNGTNLLETYDELYSSLSAGEDGYLILEPGIYDLSVKSLSLRGKIHIIGEDDDSKPLIRSRTSSFESATINNKSSESIILQNLEIMNYDRYYTNPALAPNTKPVALSVWRSFSVNPCAYKFSKSGVSHKLINVDFSAMNSEILALEIGLDIEDSSTYINCTSNSYFSFGSILKSCTGYYEKCKAEFGSFGSFSTSVKGVFKDCAAKNTSFGYAADSIEAAFSNCEIVVSENEEGEGFGLNSKNNKGYYENCKIVKEQI